MVYILVFCSYVWSAKSNTALVTLYEKKSEGYLQFLFSISSANPKYIKITTKSMINLIWNNIS